MIRKTDLSGAQPAPDMPANPPPDPADGRRDLGAALFFGLWAGVGWYAVSGDAYLWSDFGADPGPSLMPAIVLTLLTLGSFAMLVSAVRKLRASDAPWSGIDIFARLRVPLLFIASLIAMVPLMRLVGFVPAGALFAAGWTWVLYDADRDRGIARRIAEVAAATIVGVGLIYIVFVRIIHVPLP